MGESCSKMKINENEDSGDTTAENFSLEEARVTTFNRNLKRRNTLKSTRVLSDKTNGTDKSLKRNSSKMLKIPDLRRTLQRSNTLKTQEKNLLFVLDMNELLMKFDNDSFDEKEFAHLEKARNFKKGTNTVTFKKQICETRVFKRIQ